MLVPFAARADPGCRDALRGLALPRLDKLLAGLACIATDEGEAHSLTPPHERVAARAYGIEAGDGRIPWAAWQVAQSGGDAGSDAWAWVTPCHWQVGTGHVSMDDPQQLRLGDEASRTLLRAIQPYFEQDGIRLDYDAPTRWLARGEIFRALPTASLDRVAGRVIDPWMPRGEEGKPLRRLQQEMQMLLYTHPLNDERARQGLVPVNSFWVSGAGALPSAGRASPRPRPTVVDDLRGPAIAQDWQAWSAAWQAVEAKLDAAPVAQLTLCGDRNARTWSSAGTGLWQRVGSAFRRTRTAQQLEAL